MCLFLLNIKEKKHPLNGYLEERTFKSRLPQWLGEGDGQGQGQWLHLCVWEAQGG